MSTPTLSIIKRMDAIPENTPIGTEVAYVEALDNDVPVGVTLTVGSQLAQYYYGAFIGTEWYEDDYFVLLDNKIITNTEFDFDDPSFEFYSFEVYASGYGNSNPPRAWTTFHVSDVMEAIKGTASDDILRGGIGADKIIGRSGNDKLNGLYNDDVLYGGLGRDTLAGGTGEDTFLYKSIHESTVSNFDTIVTWDHTGKNKPMDLIDLSAIDANTKMSGNQDFAWLGGKEFTGHAGELRYERGASTTMIYADVDGDGKADMAIRLGNSVQLYAGDFEL